VIPGGAGDEIAEPVLRDEYPQPAAIEPVAAASGSAREESVGPWPEPEAGLQESASVRAKIEQFYKDMTAQESAISAAENRSEEEMAEGAEAGAPASAAEARETGGPAVQPPVAVPPPSPLRDGGAPPLPLESYANLSSFEKGRPEVELEVNTELHIFGRARPGSELSLFGQKVHLRPDGTFSIRKPLPHGVVVLPLLFSSRGEGA
jgi:hypothetical protein